MGFFTAIFPLEPEKSRMKFLIIIDKSLVLGIKTSLSKITSIGNILSQKQKNIV